MIPQRNRTLPTINIAADGPLVVNMDVADYFGALIQVRSVGDGCTLTVYGDLTAAKVATTNPVGLVRMDTSTAGYPIEANAAGNGLWWVPPCNSLSIDVSAFADPAELIICLLGMPWVPPAQYF